MKMINRHTLQQVLALAGAALLLTACSESGDHADVVAEVSPAMDSLVSAEWLIQHLDDPDLVVLDSTVVVQPDGDGGMQSISGRANYEAGHIPGAGFADLMGALSDQDSTYKYAMPTPEQFVATMRELGVSDNSRVVLYDTNYGVWAARVWWMLRWVGFDRAALLDGGFKAWTDAGHPVSTEPVSRSAGTLSLNLRPELIADKDEVAASLGDESVLLVDAMSAPHYRGEFTMYARPGHIPGAVNMSALSLTDEDGLYRSNEELAGLIAGDPDARTITYCGGGIAASADAFVLHRLGYKDVAVYAASLQEWTDNPENPMETEEGQETDQN